MKKFKFSLQRVLDYKQQIETSIRNQHSQAVKKVTDQEKEIEKLEEQFLTYKDKTEKLKNGNISILKLREYEQYVSFIVQRIAKEKKVLATLKKEEEAIREQVIEAKKETSSIQKLKDKKKMEYDHLIAKMQEREMEEFVSNRSRIVC